MTKIYQTQKLPKRRRLPTIDDAMSWLRITSLAGVKMPAACQV
jgi:hypothetical protein